MQKNKVINTIVKDWLTGCEDAISFDILEEFLRTGFPGLENLSNKELADCYSNPIHEDQRKEILASDITELSRNNSKRF
ncbi:MAG: hypothetical protein H6774_03070 [Pseudomonadales bacterium]|nr:hypothetical protein [Pseudomonadales bacterium]